MYIGILQLELLVHDAASLKDKRRVVRSVKDKLHRERLVAVAEVAALETYTVARLGVAAVSNDAKTLHKVMDGVLESLKGRVDCELGDHAREIVRPGQPGDENPDGGQPAQGFDAAAAFDGAHEQAVAEIEPNNDPQSQGDPR